MLVVFLNFLKNLELVKIDAQYKEIIDANTDVVVLLDQQGTQLYFNKQLEILLGYKTKDVIGKSIIEFLPKEEISKTSEILKELFLDKQTKVFESYAKHKKGHLIPVEISTQIMKYEGIHAVVCTIRDITERKIAEKDLQVERDNLKKIFGTMEDGVYVVDNKFDIEYVNPVLTKEFGDYKNRKCYEYFHNKSKVCEWCKNDDILKGKTIRWEWYSDKTKKTYDLIDTPLKNSDGTISKLEIFRDITDYKYAEKKLKESEEQYRGVIENMVEGFYKTDVNGNAILISPSVTKILGFSEEEIIGKPISSFYVDVKDREIFLETIKKGGKVENYLAKFRRKEKSNILIEVNATVIYKDGKFNGVEGVFRDVTERKKREQILKESEDGLKLIIENSTDGIAIIKDDKFVFINTPFSKILDYTVEELQNLSLKEILSEESFNYLIKGIDHLIDSDSDHIHSEVVMKKKDNSLIDAEIMIKNIKYKGEFVQVSQIRDITKQKEMIKLLKRGAEQTKGLKEYIPICAGCASIRDDDKDNKPWVKPADYISERLPEVKFSHSMCPDCMKKWYPEIYAKRN